ncbi:NB-ARC domain-containing protein [Solwaraspora sp. WMMD791]|uniref:ATP-binding protein n=1 Tax=Solwaraspora sp. WMMD791 TaxID=3016086 RepID=UPI00249C7C41|nr:NB-ARC domain-containing protein [Solwaraspora sp. WMMD791]WFE24993.1 NB-ARC domain-containing protein [Solwaraspora sp. WMMD791]
MSAEHDRGGFGQLVSSLRVAAGLTQEELAERTGLSVRAVSDLERNRVARPRRATITRLAAAFGLSEEELQRFRSAARPGPQPEVRRPLSLRPAQLPMDIPDFVGRSTLVDEISAELATAGRSGSPVVYAFSGPPGVGKSTLAVHVAHRVREHFPDGQIFADLGGVAATGPVTAGALTAAVLRAFGVTGRELPDETAERVGLLRSVLADRRALLVLDDAAAEEQVRAVLPGTAGGALLVTSRHPLAGLAGARFVAVGVLTPAESLALLGTITGARRVSADVDAAGDVTRHCGHLPLAVRVVGARLAVAPGVPIGVLRDQLAVESQRLDGLTAGDLGVRASISLSVDLLAAPARRALPLLSLLDAPTLTGWAAAAVLDTDPSEALDALVRASLLDAVPAESEVGGGRAGYRFHDLIRAYGRETAAAELDAGVRTAAVRRGIRAYAAMADTASRHLPGDTLRAPRPMSTTPVDDDADPALAADPLGWFDVQRPALLAAIGQGLATDDTLAAVAIADAMVDYWATRGLFDEWRDVAERTLRRCEALGDAAGTARMAHRLAEWHVVRQQFDRADVLLARALTLAAEIGDPAGQANALLLLGANDRSAGRLADASARLATAAELFAAAGMPTGTGHALVQAAVAIGPGVSWLVRCSGSVGPWRSSGEAATSGARPRHCWVPGSPIWPPVRWTRRPRRLPRRRRPPGVPMIGGCGHRCWPRWGTCG